MRGYPLFSIPQQTKTIPMLRPRPAIDASNNINHNAMNRGSNAVQWTVVGIDKELFIGFLRAKLLLYNSPNSLTYNSTTPTCYLVCIPAPSLVYAPRADFS